MYRSIALIALLAVGCKQPADKKAETAAAPAKHDYGVTARYSSDFSIGNPSPGNTVVSFWKNVDANKIADSKSMLADSVYVEVPGLMQMMSRDSVIAVATRERATMSELSSEVDAIIPVKASEKDEDLVCIWGSETSVRNNVKMKRDIAEVWGFDKNGKVNWIKQYELRK